MNRHFDTSRRSGGPLDPIPTAFRCADCLHVWFLLDGLNWNGCPKCESNIYHFTEGVENLTEAIRFFAAVEQLGPLTEGKRIPD